MKSDICAIMIKKPPFGGDYLFSVFSAVGRVRSTNVMRPLSKSYGVISTRTFSPTLTQMRNLRILPHTVAKISCPFSKRTRNIVFGNLSITVPLKTITSSFAIVYSTLYLRIFISRTMILFQLKNCKLFLSACTNGTDLIK